MDELIRNRPCHPERAAQGWTCAQWRSAPGEWFCGLCGLPLPPLELTLDPAIGSSARDSSGQRRVNIHAVRTPATRDQDLGDFELLIDVTDREEQSDRIDIPLEKGQKQGEMELDLQARAHAAFDVMVGLRNRANPDPAHTVLIGAYDYATPAVKLGQAAIAIPAARGPFTARLSLALADARALSAKLKISGAEIVGTVRPADADADILLRFEPDDATWKTLEGIHGTRDAELTVEFHGVAGGKRVPGVRIERLTPPDLRLTIADRTRGLTGRRARVAMLIRNVGGSSATIAAVHWTLSATSGAVAASGTADEFAGRIVEAQNELHDDLRPPLVAESGEPLPAGLYRLAVEIVFQSGGEDKKDARKADLEVRADRVFDGRVCIDFGTTDTAAAFIARGDSYFLDPRSTGGHVPQPIELGRIGLAGRPSRFFLPTRAAIGMGAHNTLEVRYAAEAVETVGDLKQGRLVDRLKWRLGEKEEIEGFSESMTIQQIVIGYLRHVRELIEEHPSVAARIERVYATRPAVFGAKSALLIEAFKQAGMVVDLQSFGAGVPPLVSESWPPVLMALPFEEGGGATPSARILDSLFGHFAGEHPLSLIDTGALAKTAHYLCTFDVGGGSTDISLLRLHKVEDLTRISDLAIYTHEKFAGEGFRDLILKECALLTPEAAEARDVEGPERDNLRALQTFASELQHFPNGPFGEIYSSVVVFFGGFATASEKEKAEIQHLLGNAALDAPWPPADASQLIRDLCGLKDSLSRVINVYKLTLQTEAGLPVTQSFGATENENAFGRLLFRIILRFAQTFSAAIDDIFDRLVARLDVESEKGPVRVLVTGRGGLFPLAEAMIRVRAMKFLDPERDEVIRSAGESAKAVTSWGGLALSVARTENEYLEFTGLGRNTFAVYASRQPDGHRPRAVMQRLSDENDIWGVPLASLENVFQRTRIVILGDDRDDGGDPEERARLSQFNLKEELKARPAAWIVFDSNQGTLEVRDMDETIARSGDGN